MRCKKVLARTAQHSPDPVHVHSAERGAGVGEPGQRRARPPGEDLLLQPRHHAKLHTMHWRCRPLPWWHHQRGGLVPHHRYRWSALSKIIPPNPAKVVLKEKWSLGFTCTEIRRKTPKQVVLKENCSLSELRLHWNMNGKVRKWFSPFTSPKRLYP